MAFRPRGPVVIGSDYLRFVAEDQNGNPHETVVPTDEFSNVEKGMTNSSSSSSPSSRPLLRKPAAPPTSALDCHRRAARRLSRERAREFLVRARHPQRQFPGLTRPATTLGSRRERRASGDPRRSYRTLKQAERR